MKTQFFGALAAGAMALAVANPAAAQEFPEMTLTYAHFLPETFAQVDLDQRYADLIEERSGGNIKMEIFYGGQMGSPLEVIDLVGSGAVDMGTTAQGYFPNELPISAVLGYLLRTSWSPHLTHELSMEVYATEAAQEEFETNNVLPLYTHSANPYRLTCNKPVRTMDDTVGLRVRSIGAFIPDYFEGMGMTPVATPFAEMYESLERGAIDCSWMPHDQVFAMKLDEVAPYGIDFNTGAPATWQVWINKDMFESWPQHVQDLFTDTAMEIMQYQLDRNLRLQRETVEELYPETGMELVEFQDLEELKAEMPDTVDLWMASMEERGLAEKAAPVEAILRRAQAQFKEDYYTNTTVE